MNLAYAPELHELFKKKQSLLLKFSKTRNDSKVSSFMFKTRISSCIRSR